MKERLYVGVDIGGTKISAALVTTSGRIFARMKHPTPRGAGYRQFFSALVTIIRNLLKQSRMELSATGGIGISVPGLVDPDKGKIHVAPNLNLKDVNLRQSLKKTFKVPVEMDNDVNLGLLGEQWLGAGRGADHVIGLFMGTGLGGGIIIDGRIYSGAHGVAAELGHVVMDMNGPRCSCGNQGCLEALVGRWAIERDLREAVEKGRDSCITKINSGNGLKTIKSKVLRKALERKDPLVTEVMQRAASNLALGCVQFLHVFDPDRIVLGGGVIEACGKYILPVVRKAMKGDPLYDSMPSCPVVISKLGDDAVILGAVANLIQRTGRKLIMNPVAEIGVTRSGGIRIDGRVWEGDVYVRSDGKVRERKSKKALKRYGSAAKVGPRELKRMCRKGAEILYIGTAGNPPLSVSREGTRFLKESGVSLKIAPVADAARLYQETDQPRAILLQGGVGRSLKRPSSKTK